MGQKVNALGLRLGINRTWGSKWYDSLKGSYAPMLMKDLQIRSYLTDIFKKQKILVGYIQISRSRGVTFISFPAFLISQKEGNLSERKNNFWLKLLEEKKLLEKTISNWVKGPTYIKIDQVDSYFKDSTLLARYVVHLLESRIPVKSILKSCLEESRKEETIRGIRIQCSGRLDGAEMAKNEWVKDGQVPLHTLHAFVDYGTSLAHTIYGVCGVKVWICFHPRKEQYRIFPSLSSKSTSNE